jgi:hypothetical protein
MSAAPHEALRIGGRSRGAFGARCACGMPAMRFARKYRLQSRLFAQYIDNTCYSFPLWEGAQKAEFLRQALISLLYSPRSGEALLAASRSPLSFEFRRTALKEHKFQIGETVYFTSRPIGHMAANSTYQVVRLLPSDGFDYQYRIKNANEAFERVARESQLEYTG